MKIKVGDKFDKIVDVMNDVFGWNYKSCFRGFYYLNDEKNTEHGFQNSQKVLRNLAILGMVG